MKYTRKEVEGMFNRLLKASGKSADEWFLDYISCYGGYVIQKQEGGGGCSHPFGCLRRSAREMYLSMHMTVEALEDIKYKEQLKRENIT